MSAPATPQSTETRDAPAARTASATRVAFQGERGAFSEEAVLRLLGGEITLVPRPTFESLFASVGEGAADFALAPVENTLAGSVQRSYDLLLESPLHIVAEVIIPIRHCLIGCPGSSFDSIKTVESHPVALAQCERFFAAHAHLRRVTADDTAGSVAQIVRLADTTRAAIAGHRAAEIYGGVILREGVEDDRRNYTRFVLLASKPEVNEGADKLSLALTLPHGPGALCDALAPFARRRIDLLKIESHPVKGEPWRYHIFFDLRASLLDAEAAEALAELRAMAASVRVLGCYPSARVAQTEELMG